MGTIVINQTDCKQNVVLQSSLDGVTGGYYDAAGVWHELKGGAASADDFDYTIGGVTKAYSGGLADSVYRTALTNRFNTALPMRNEYNFESGDDYDIIGFEVDDLDYSIKHTTSVGYVAAFTGDASQTTHAWGKTVNSDANFIWLDIRRSDDANITDADIAAFKAQLKVIMK